MQDQMREEEKRLLNQEDTFENLVDDSDGEVDIRKNPRVVGGMEGSDSDSEVCIFLSPPVLPPHPPP